MLNYCRPFERRILLCGGGGEEGVVFRDTFFSKYPRQVWKCGSSCFFPLISLIFWIYWVGQKVCFENPNELLANPIFLPFYIDQMVMDNHRKYQYLFWGWLLGVDETKKENPEV